MEITNELERQRSEIMRRYDRLEALLALFGRKEKCASCLKGKMKALVKEADRIQGRMKGHNDDV